MTTAEFFATHTVFSLDEAARALAPPGGRAGTVERLKHHLQKGRLKAVTRGVYAVVPPGVAAGRFQPDPILVAAATRPDAVFAYHAALDLLGAAHSVFRETTVFTAARRGATYFGTFTVRFLGYPGALSAPTLVHLGTRQVDRRGRLLRCTGPERTLLEGFRRPGLVGGVEELVLSAAGFPTLDMGLLEEVLGRYDLATLWAAAGWFLERFQAVFHVPDDVIARFETRRPRSPHYLERDRRGGVLVDRWNLILPEEALQAGSDLAR
jgi:predicted transcriptional regulator of viral defense system